MFRNRVLMLIAGGLLALPAGASTILNTFPDGPSGYTNGYLLEAETFVVGSDTVLSSFAFQTFNAIGQAVQIEVYAWGASGPTGSALYTSSSVARTNALLNLTVNGINLGLTQGSEYGVVVDAEGYSGENAAYNLSRTSYTGGDLWLLENGLPTWLDRSDLNLYFQATFVAGVQTAPSSSAPEPGAMVLMGAGLAGLGVARKVIVRAGS